MHALIGFASFRASRVASQDEGAAIDLRGADLDEFRNFASRPD
jgi:hypothetical protein